MFSSIKSPLFPILGNPDFPPGLDPGAFGSLMEKGCFQASQFLTFDTCPMIDSLMQLRGQFEIHFWQVLQVLHYFESLGSLVNYPRQCTKFELYCEEKELFLVLFLTCMPC